MASIVLSPLAATLDLTPAHLWLRSERPLSFLSSAPGGDGVAVGRHIISLYVDKTYRSDEPERDLAALAERLGVAAHEGWVGLMTGVALDKAAVVVREHDGLAVAAVVTVGLGNASAAGRDPTGGWFESPPPAGTINTIVLVGAPLTAAGAVNAAMTATEAKALALADRGIRTRAGDLASGTSSDAIVIAAPLPTADGPQPLRYAGTATALGWLIGRAVREAITSRLPDRSPGTID
ncbi:MAG: adenosylcobinamide amidohydrolase [Thermomicrobiales bacterium]